LRELFPYTDYTIILFSNDYAIRGTNAVQIITNYL